MAINKNHEFEELDGVKCGIVEKNVTAERVQFLKKILEYNGFTVVTIPSPPPKAAAAPVLKTEEARPDDPVGRGEAVSTAQPEPVKGPETFTVGVTDYTFNTINAIFGRLLKTPDGHIITLGYWQQKESVSNDEVPYFGNKAG